MVTPTGPARRSVEVEYWVVDGEGRLTEPGVLAELPGAEREFVEPLLEVKTSPCETTAELREELFGRLRDVLNQADELDRYLVPLATPLCPAEVEELPSERTRVQNRVVGEPFRHVRHCAGTHVHVEQEPGREADQYNALVALDPALALVNSTPFYRGERLARGARSKLYRRLAYADLSHQGRLWRYIDSTEEWARRLERRYEEFVTRARDAGVDRQTIETNFDPESAVWTPVQLRSEFSTVEWRSPDAALPSQVLRLADKVAQVAGDLPADVRIEGSTGQVTDESVLLPEFGSVLEYLDAAIKEGLSSSPLRAYLGRMGFDVGAYRPAVADFDGHDRVTRATARRLRLEHAKRLERDVHQAAPTRK